jgi:glycosyltransferase involved in cell wall biosynthesis
MRIGVDIRPFLRQETGVGVYLKNLLFHLAAIDKTDEYCLFSSSWKDRFLEEKIPPFTRLDFRDFRIPVKVLNTLWRILGRPSLDELFRKRIDLAHSPTPLVLPAAGKRLVTVCDLFFMDYPHRADREARQVFLAKIKRSLQKADGIITISEFSKGAILERFPVDEKKILVTYPGLSPEFREESKPEDLVETRARYGLPLSFLLFVGALEPRKNIPGLIEALKIIHRAGEKIVLAVAGREGGDSAVVREKIRRDSLGAYVKILGYVPGRAVRDLYRAATVFVFPSYCEGFGFPLVEAMACGLPVAAAEGGALPEVGTNAALYFDPNNAEDMAEKILFLLRSGEARKALAETGKQRVRDFDWERTASRTLEFYRSVAGVP